MLLRLILLLNLTYICAFKVSGQDLKVHPIKFTHLQSISQAPKIDGIFEPQEWQNATLLTDFILTNGAKGNPAKQNTQAYLMYDQSFLYIGIVCQNSEKAKLQTNAQQHDDPLIFYDDRVELFLDANHDHRSYYNLAVNAQGILFDQEIVQPLPNTRTHYPDVAWNAFWTAQTQIKEDHWIAEIAISLASLGIEAIHPGTTLGFNIGRAHSPKVQPGDDLRTFEVHAPSEYSAWVQVQDGIWETVSNFYAPESFGDLVFGDPGFHLKSIAFPDASFNGSLGQTTKPGQNPLTLHFDSLQHDVRLEVIVTEPTEGGIFDKHSKENIRWTNELIIPKGSKEIHTEYTILGEQEQKLWISLVDTESNILLYRTSYILIVPPFISYDLEALYSPSANKQAITFNIDAKLGNLSLQLRFMDKHHQVIDSASFLSLPAEGQPTPVFDAAQLRRLEGGNYFIESRLIDPQTEEVILTSTQALTKFSMSPPPDELEAVEESYSYGGIEGHAVVVKFPSSARFVFWKPASYVPWWDMDQAVTSNEFVESWGEGIEGCAEPLQDRECRFSSVEIIENTHARVKVMWRYALNDTHYRIHANEWVEEYYTFYPDGTGIREVILYATTQKAHEVFEAIYVNPPQVSTYQLYDHEIASLKNLEGDKFSVRQLSEDESLYNDFISNNQQLIFESHFKDRLHPYTVFALDSSLLPHMIRENFSVGKYLSTEGTRRGHWPASRYAVDGYNAVGDDVPGHFNLGNIHVMSQTDSGPNRWIFLIGAKQANDTSDVRQAKNWLAPPKLTCLSQPALQIRYDQKQKAYIIPSNRIESKITMTVEDGTLLHPALIFTANPTAAIQSIHINQQKVDPTHYQVGNVDDRMILFLNMSLHADDQLTIESSSN